jgi:hypothetical protein
LLKISNMKGMGVYSWADGRKYEGEWKNGKQHGKGKYILLDGEERMGLWEDGKRIKWVQEEQRNKEIDKDTEPNLKKL